MTLPFRFATGETKMRSLLLMIPWFLLPVVGRGQQLPIDNAPVIRESKFIRGDFTQVIIPKDYKGPIKIVEPRGDFAKIDVVTTNELLVKLLADDPEVRAEALEQFKRDADLFAPTAYFLVASNMFELGDKEGAMFWLLLGKLRALSDAMKSDDETTFQAILVLGHLYGMRIEEEFVNYRKAETILKKVLAWDESHVRKYDPRWIALHGMEAFKKFRISFKPKENWSNIDTQARNDLKEGLDFFFRAAEKADADGDGVLSKAEQLAMERIPLEVSPEVRRKSMCSDSLFNDICNMPGGVLTMDEVNFPGAKRRKVIDVEVVVPIGGTRNGVERWTVERDSGGTCFYTVILVPGDSGGTFFVTSSECEALRPK
jgi:hypothetical protein